MYYVTRDSASDSFTIMALYKFTYLLTYLLTYMYCVCDSVRYVKPVTDVVMKRSQQTGDRSRIMH